MANTLRYNNTVPGNIYYGGAAVQNVYYNNTKVWSASRPFTFTYTGAYETEGNLEGNFIIRFKTSGTLTITSHGNNTGGSYDLFAVGGGGGGGWYSDPSGVLPFGGGGGGYTKTSLGVALSVGSYQITIGAGGGQNVDGQTTSFGSQLSVSGGTTAKEYWSSSDIPYSGGDGGSGGGPNHGNGGSDGSNGTKFYESIVGVIGHGQGTTTREFGESTGILYAGGGGGATYDSRYPYYFGGAGGGGNGARRYTGTTEVVVATAGTPNTGGGGGGGLNWPDADYYGASGGSGIVCIRNHR